MIESDEDLMMKVKERRDELAFERLVQRHRKPLLNFVYRFIGDQDIAEDVSQDIFLKLWSSADTYLPLARFTTFLYTIAKNLCLNILAKIKSSPQTQSINEILFTDNNDHDMQSELADSANQPDQEILSIEIQDKIKEAIGKLTPEHRLVFILTEYHGLSYQEVANIAQCPIGTVASRKNTAVKQLKRYLEPLINI